MSLAYVSSPLDRAEDKRRDQSTLEALQNAADARFLRVRDDRIAMADGQPDVRRGLPSDQHVFLGHTPDGAPWFASRAEEGETLEPLRGLMLSGQVSQETLSILAQARSLVHWHERHGFCANCGVATTMEDGGYRRHCATCKADHFPRTDPVVIMAVTWNEHVLLGRQASWPEGMYSALAGFMEPGETIEDAARREVYEEAGIRVGKVRYVTSQPWPFPSSLMIGLIGEASTSEIRIDTHELQDARWFSFAEARSMMDRTHPQGFVASHSYAIAHHLVAAVLHHK